MLDHQQAVRTLAQSVTGSIKSSSTKSKLSAVRVQAAESKSRLLVMAVSFEEGSKTQQKSWLCMWDLSLRGISSFDTKVTKYSSLYLHFAFYCSHWSNRYPLSECSSAFSFLMGSVLWTRVTDTLAHWLIDAAIETGVMGATERQNEGLSGTLGSTAHFSGTVWQEASTAVLPTW